MIKFANAIGLLAAVLSFSASAQTVQMRTLDQAGSALGAVAGIEQLRKAL
jgi:hypothetical protein